MAQNITLMGASYSDVPAVLLPKTGGGTAQFDDTTIASNGAAASDIASGKLAYVNGSLITGTASGGGGASNIVQGTFTTGSSRSSGSTVALGYTGTGYPIALLVYVDGGAYNNSASGNTTWYNSVDRYDVGWFGMVKSRTTTTPTWTSGIDSQGCVAVIYKNSTTSATTYTRTSSMTANIYVSSTTTAGSSTTCCRLRSDGKLAYMIGGNGSQSIGLAPSTKYAYIVIYSS